MFCLADRFHQTLPGWRHIARLGTAAAVALALSACGGGDQVDKFQPNKIVSFGDEASALVSVDVGGEPLKGLKYTVNSLAIERGVASVFDPLLPAGATFDPDQWTGFYPAFSGTRYVVTPANTPESETRNSVVRFEFTADVDYKDAAGVSQSNSNATVGFDYGYLCNANRLWIQLVASGYGLGYESQCGLETGGAISYAQAGARVSEDLNLSGGVTVQSIKSQVAAHRAELDSQTLVTMLAGQNDILAEYQAVRDTGAQHAAARARLFERGRELAAIVNDLTRTGARILIVTVPNLGLTPYARMAGENSELLRQLTESFNNGFVGAGGVLNDGNKIGLVSFDDEVNRIAEDPSDYGFANMTTPLCTSSRKPDGTTTVAATPPGLFFGGEALLYCTSYTFAGNISTYFWSDPVNLSPGAHARLGNLAYLRADDNPF